LARILAKQQVIGFLGGQERIGLQFFLALLEHLATGHFLPINY
jgi:hypothetical protein